MCECAPVLSRSIMYLTSVRSAASRAAYSRLFAPPVDLDSGDQSRDFPVVGEEFTGCGDLAVSVQLDVLRFTMYPDAPLFGAQKQFCTEVREVVWSASLASATPGAVRVYEAFLRSVVSNLALQRCRCRAKVPFMGFLRLSYWWGLAVLHQSPFSQLCAGHLWRWSMLRYRIGALYSV